MRERINSIEVLNASDEIAGKPDASWRLIQAPKDVLSPRANPVVIAINYSEILIMGGYHNVFMGDAIIFNSVTGALTLDKK